MKKIIYFLFLAICCVACDSDDDVIKKTFTCNDLDGEWLCYDEENGTSAIDMQLAARGYSYQATIFTDIYSNMDVYDSQYGFFSYYKASNMIRMQVASQKEGNSETVDYLLTDVDDCTLKLCSKKFNCIDVFYKVVDSRELAFGQTAQMDISQISSFTPSEYQVLNNNVATVDESGCVTACGIGSTFVVAKDGDKRVAMKITVTSLVDVHAAEVYESVDDVLEKYGNPDVQADLANNSAGILYKKPSFEPTASAIEFDYDKTSRKMTKIMVKYNSQDSFETDKKYIVDHFYAVDLGDIYYCDQEDILASKVHILPFLSTDGNYYITYGSSTYFFTYGHY